MLDPRLVLIRGCPDRVPPPSENNKSAGVISKQATCLSGRGAIPGHVTLCECLDCVTGSGLPRPKYVFRKDILFRAALTSWTGYGQIGEWLGRGMESLGLQIGYLDSGTDLRFIPQRSWLIERIVPPWAEATWSVLLAPPHNANPANPLEKVVRFTMWETSRISPVAVANLNAAELVCVPCEANRKWFIESGVKSPIAIVPMGIAPGEGYYDDGTDPPQDVCRFGMAGRMAHGAIRKGLNEGMEAFIAAFPESMKDVELVLKVWPDCLGRLRVPADPRIKVVTTPMRPREMAQWYRTLTALFVPSKGEGWGLHTHQAMAVGRPVIAAVWSGTAEFWDAECGWPLEYDLAPAGEFYAGEGEWAVPRHDSMVEQLRYVYEHRDEAKARGKKAARRAAEFTWDRTARCLHRALSDSGLLGSGTRIEKEPSQDGEVVSEGPRVCRDTVGSGNDDKIHWDYHVDGDEPTDSISHSVAVRPINELESLYDIPIVIMTAVRPEPYLDQTLASLAPTRRVTLMVGTPETAYLESHLGNPLLRIVPPEPGEYATVKGKGVSQHAAWNYWRCLGEGETHRRLLIVEDDVRFAVGWYQRLAAIIERIERQHVDYVVSLYYPYAREHDRGMRYIHYNKACFYGTQGILFAGRSLGGYRRYLREWGLESWVKPYDLLLSDYVRELDIPLFATMPSLVQHIGAVTTGQSAGFHTTGCFDENVECP